MAVRGAANPAARPKKRPTQDRAKFTVQVLFDTFVRIWRRDGPDAATMRAVAEESGFAIGTLYDYFPNREALLSGYVRHTIEYLIARLETEQVTGEGLAWTERLDRLVRLTAGTGPDSPYFDRAMLLMENQIAEPHHHRRAFEELSGRWCAAIAAWPDLPAPVDDGRIRDMFMMVWGARRYRLLVEPDSGDDWVATLEVACRALVARGKV